MNDGVRIGVAANIWRHPRPRGDIAGRCIGGRTDLAVDRRKAKRLAHRIRQHARRHHLPPVVVTSGLQRAAAVGRWLAAWGWTHRIDARLAEFDFGHWDGEPWERIGQQAMEAWTRDFARHRPGGGECIAELLARCAGFLADPACHAVCAVGHAGWISAARWLASAPGEVPVADRWPGSIGYAQRANALDTATATS